MARLAGKVAVITGGGSGFGRATAQLFAREGARVVAADIDEAAARATVEAIVAAGGEAAACRADVSVRADVQAMLRLAVDRFGALDVLFNNAGVPQQNAPIDIIPEDVYDQIMAVNVKGVFLGCQLAVPLMRERGGAILNTASAAALKARPGTAAYSASKGAVAMLSKQLAVELAPFKIRVNALCPVAANTPMLPKFRAAGAGQASASAQPLAGGGAFGIPMGRLCEVDDVAHAALYLASDEAAFISGVEFPIDGAYRA